MTNIENYHRVAKQFHDTIVNSDMDRMGVLLAFTQIWCSCNVQMELGESNIFDTKKFTKETKRDLNQCRDLILESIPQLLEDIFNDKQTKGNYNELFTNS